MAVRVVRVGLCRMCVWPGVAWVLEVRAALEQQKLYVRRARGAGVGSTLLGVCWARGAWEEWFRAWVSPQLGDSRRKTAWSCLLGALRLGGMVMGSLTCNLM